MRVTEAVKEVGCTPTPALVLTQIQLRDTGPA